MEKTNATPLSKSIISKLKNCLYQRLKLFDEEASGYSDSYVMVRLNPARIEYHYPDPLGRKMKESISERDYRYCTSMIEEYLNSLN